MGFLKVIKNRAYFKRFQVKYRRRRAGKTDYYARKRLITQDKYKYNYPKYRFVVRLTNRDIICQIIYSKINGDYVLSSAYSHELPRYGMKAGLTNYSAAYATGLLLARRVLAKIGLDKKYEGNLAPNGEDYKVEELSEGPRPFKALLDIGLVRTTTGAKVFSALKGACDGGLNIPHSEKRFVGFDSENKKGDPEILRKYIFGGHVSDYMKILKSENSVRFQSQFADYLKNGIGPDDIKSLWEQTHRNIRKDPSPAPKIEKPIDKQKYKKQPKLTIKQRKLNIKKKREELKKK